MAELFIGLMSGTSADAVDAALVDFSSSLPRCLAHHRLPYPPLLQRQIRSIDRNTPLGTLASLDVGLAELFAQAALGVIQGGGWSPGDIRAIGSHGQTVWHEPAGDPPFTLQIGDPNVIAERTGITTVADFRRRDVAAGGQGAPLVPAFHGEVFLSQDEDRCVLNLGGIANITVLPRGRPDGIFGFDTGPANTLLDAWSLRHRNEPFDRDGAWGGGGRVVADLLGRLMSDPYLGLPPPKSTGREHFNLEWLARQLPEGLRPEDVQATLAEFTAASVAAAVLVHAPASQRLLVCGGGVRNRVVMEALARRLAPRSVESTADYGIDPDLVEACAFAWLARQTLSGRAGNLPAVTGARHAVPLGGIYGRAP